jgi:hypothetical protein
MDVINTSKKYFWKAAHWSYAHRAQIAFVAGGIATAVGAKMVINNAEAIAEVNKQVKKDRETYKEINEEGKEGWEEYGESKIHYILGTGLNHTIGYAKTAGPGLAVMAIGYGLAGYALKTTTDDLVAVSAQAAATAQLFAAYRKRVVEDQGAEKDREYLTGQKIVSTYTDENGQITTVEDHYSDDSVYIPHSFFFDETHDQWTKSNMVNRDTADTWLRVINHELSIKQFLTENDMRDICHAPRTKVGNTAGARYQNPDGTTNAVVFNESMLSRFLNGDDPSGLFIFEYADGRPIEDNIMLDINWETGL